MSRELIKAQHEENKYRGDPVPNERFYQAGPLMLDREKPLNEEDLDALFGKDNWVRMPDGRTIPVSGPYHGDPTLLEVVRRANSSMLFLNGRYPDHDKEHMYLHSSP